MNLAVNRFAGAAPGREPRADRPIRLSLSGLTIRDLEAEALARLARRGFDWTGALARRGETP